MLYITARESVSSIHQVELDVRERHRRSLPQSRYRELGNYWRRATGAAGGGMGEVGVVINRLNYLEDKNRPDNLISRITFTDLAAGLSLEQRDHAHPCNERFWGFRPHPLC